MSTAEKLTIVATKLAEMDESIGIEAELITELQSVVDNIPYDSNGSYDAGYADGQKAGQDTLWDGLQNFGSRTDYSRLCKLCGKLDDWFYPKYDMKLDNGNEMFRGANCSTSFDLAQRLEDCGIVLDTSKCTSTQMMFAYCNVKRIPTLDFSAIKTSGDMVYAFIGCTYLEDLRLSGTVSVSGLDLSSSTKLNKASIESVINALSTTTSGLSITLSETAVNAAYDEGVDAAQWLASVDSKPNWTINLV